MCTRAQSPTCTVDASNLASSDHHRKAGAGLERLERRQESVEKEVKGISSRLSGIERKLDLLLSGGTGGGGGGGGGSGSSSGKGRSTDLNRSPSAPRTSSQARTNTEARATSAELNRKTEFKSAALSGFGRRGSKSESKEVSGRRGASRNASTERGQAGSQNMKPPTQLDGGERREVSTEVLGELRARVSRDTMPTLK